MRHTKQIACLDLIFSFVLLLQLYTANLSFLAGLKLTHFDDQKERGREGEREVLIETQEFEYVLSQHKRLVFF